MAEKPLKEKAILPWDRRPWPANGDRTPNDVYCMVGLMLSQWERYEMALSHLFSAFVSSGDSYAPRRAYVAVRTFEGRAEMLRAASSAYFDENPDERLLNTFKDILRNAIQYSQRRNDVAHGVVDYFGAEESWGEESEFDNGTFALYPSEANFKERTIFGKPSYCMTSIEIDYFFEKIYKLHRPAVNLAINISKRKREPNPLLGIFYRCAPRSANLSADQNSPQEGESPPKSSQE